ncbi:MAG TPA: SDR family NAD(P)-dependent oxidoreductase [Devosia sp.]|nr:SDR family NAD(P)-dependent oxidoreductase [Devosia sp.]
MSTPIGQTVLVAGASSGMGRAIAAQAAAAGANLILVARRADQLAELAAELTAQHGQITVTALALDTTDAAGLSAALAGRNIDVLVNSVGTNLAARAFDTLTPESWADMINVNLTSAFNLIRAVLPGMRARKGGLIINIASTAARRADKSGAAYQAAKAGVVALNNAVMEEERENGIRLTAILPGMTNTPLLDKRPVPVSAQARAAALQPEDVAAACLFVMALPARAHVAEIMLQPSGS